MTGLAEARAAIEANLGTGEGAEFHARMRVNFFANHLEAFRACRAEVAGMVSFRILLKLDQDGAAEEILLEPSSRFGECARKEYFKDKFLAPPRGSYWVGVDVKVSSKLVAGPRAAK